jgi:hypothetical protein
VAADVQLVNGTRHARAPARRDDLGKAARGSATALSFLARRPKVKNKRNG